MRVCVCVYISYKRLRLIAGPNVSIWGLVTNSRVSQWCYKGVQAPPTTTTTMSTFCWPWGLNPEPCISQPSPLQTEVSCCMEAQISNMSAHNCWKRKMSAHSILHKKNLVLVSSPLDTLQGHLILSFQLSKAKEIKWYGVCSGVKVRSTVRLTSALVWHWQ